MDSSPTLIRLPGVMARTGLGRSEIYARISRGEFPKPVKLGERASAWVEREIAQYIEARIAAREDKAGKSVKVA